MATSSGRGSQPGDEEVDAAFADIIANWNTEPSHGDNSASDLRTATSRADAFPTTYVRDEPSNTLYEADDDQPHTSDHSTEAPDRPRRIEEVFGPAGQASGWRTFSPPDEPDEDFVPGDPAPLPSRDIGFWVAIGGVTLGPLALILLTVFAPHTRTLWFVLAIAATLAGFGILVLRLPPTRGDDDDPQDGAVI